MHAIENDLANTITIPCQRCEAYRKQIADLQAKLAKYEQREAQNQK